MATPAEVVQRKFAAILAGDLEAIRSNYSDGVQYRDPGFQLQGIDAVLAHLGKLMLFAPDTRGSLTVLRSSADCVFAECILAGTHTGPFPLGSGCEIPPTGHPFTIRLLTLHEIQDGCIVAERNYWDTTALLMQLGLTPTGERPMLCPV